MNAPRAIMRITVLDEGNVVRVNGALERDGRTRQRDLFASPHLLSQANTDALRAIVVQCYDDLKNDRLTMEVTK